MDVWLNLFVIIIVIGNKGWVIEGIVFNRVGYCLQENWAKYTIQRSHHKRVFSLIPSLFIFPSNFSIYSGVLKNKKRRTNFLLINQFLYFLFYPMLKDKKMQTYSKQRQKSPLVKHYHRQELKRLDKTLYQIRHRKKGLLPSNNKENSLPILSPRYQLPLTRQQQIQQENERLSSRIAEMKIKDSEYFRRILKQKQKVKNFLYEERNKKLSQKVKLIYSNSVSGLLSGHVTAREEKFCGKTVPHRLRKGGHKKTFH